MATLLPNGKQQFISENGEPYANGKVYFYIPATTVFKDTYQNSQQTILNTNPVVLDAAGRAVIYGEGVYRQILVDADDVQIWDQLTGSETTTLYAGVATGSADVIVLTLSPPLTAYVDGDIIEWKAASDNATTTPTINVNTLGAKTVVFPDNSALYAGAIKTGGIYQVAYTATTDRFQLIGVKAGIADGSVTNAMLATMAANTVKVNATAGAASPSDLALAASRLLGRGSTGNIAAIVPNTGLETSGTDLNVKQATVADLGGGRIADGPTMRALSSIERIVTPGGIALMRYSSAAILPVFGSSGTVSHGLGVSPRFYRAVFVCVTANNNWVIGEEVSINAVEDTSDRGVMVSKTSATQLKWRIGTSGVRLLNNSGTGFDIVAAEWDMFIEAEV
jgi:hypothetical protein